MPPSRIGSFYALVSDVNAVVNVMFTFASNGDAATFERWKVERINELRKRIPVSAPMIPVMFTISEQSA